MTELLHQALAADIGLLVRASPRQAFLKKFYQVRAGLEVFQALGIKLIPEGEEWLFAIARRGTIVDNRKAAPSAPKPSPAALAAPDLSDIIDIEMDPT